MEHADRLSAPADVPLNIQALAARNLQLLQTIESTLTGLASDVKLLNAVADGFEEVSERLQQKGLAVALDPRGQLCNALTLAADSAQRMYTRAAVEHDAVSRDPRLTREDGVADAYQAYLNALGRVFDSSATLKDWIATHDALLEPGSGKVYDNVDDLFAAMGL
jgi:hypothetical protein